VAKAGKASEIQRYEMVDALMLHGAPRNYVDFEGYTPLQLARKLKRSANVIARLEDRVVEASELQEVDEMERRLALNSPSPPSPRRLSIAGALTGLGLTEKAHANGCGQPTPAPAVPRKRMPAVDSPPGSTGTSKRGSVTGARRSSTAPVARRQSSFTAQNQLSNKGGVNTDELFGAALEGDANAVEELVVNGINLDTPTKDGTTLLLQTTSTGYVEVVSKLLEAGVDASRQDFQGNTPLFNAILNAHVEIVHLLVKHRADLAYSDDETGYTPLHMAVAKAGKASEIQRYEMVDALMLHGAPRNFVDMEGCTPIQLARESKRSPPVVSRLDDRVMDASQFQQWKNLQASGSASGMRQRTKPEDHQEQANSLLCVLL